MKIAVSACLLGKPCRYNATGCYMAQVDALHKNHVLVPVCPEVLGGLATPRAPSEICKGKVINTLGQDVSEAFEKGAKEALAIVEDQGCQIAILQQRSPSCGCGKIYDGTFSSKLIEGDGVFTKLLKSKGISVLSSDALAADPAILEETPEMNVQDE